MTTEGRGRRVVVTGGAGFIGVNASLRLAERGWSVLAVDNLARPGSERNAAELERAGIALAQADVRDPAAVETAIAGADAVIHMAAQVAVTTSLAEPVADFVVNAGGTLNVLDAVRRLAPEAVVIYASTNKVYGGLEQVPLGLDERGRWWPADRRPGVTEAEPLDFHSPYGCSKGAADQYVRDFARCYGMRTAVFRQSCVYGPRQYGNEDQGWVAHFVHAALDGRPLTVYGDGRQVRDLLHVDDLVDLYERVLEAPAAAAGRIFNTGGGAANARSVLEVLESIHDRLGLPRTWSFGTEREGDQRWFVSDNSALDAALGWRPRTGFDEGLEGLTGWARALRA